LKTTPKVTLTNPDSIVAKQIVIVQDSIFIDGSGGTGFLKYSIGGGTFTDKNTFGGLTNGSYTLTIKDDNGCTKSYPFKISALTVLIDDFKKITCFGEKNGELTLKGEGGVPPYQYSIDNGANFQATPVFNNLAAGTYSLVIKDNSNYTKSTNYKVSAPALLELAADKNGNDITLNAKGGTQPYTYTLDNGAAQNSNVFNAVPSGSHQFTVIDANACKTVLTIANVSAFDLVENLGVSIAPNPTSDIATIRFETSIENAIELTINDLQGRLLLKSIIPSHTNHYKINLSDLPNATYQVVLKNGEKIGVMKLVVLK
jgi:hypothetical protein